MKKLLVSMMLILGMLAFAAESAPSSTVGYVKFSNVTTGTTNFNFMSYPVDAGYGNVSTFDVAGTYMDQINGWDQVTQSWVTASKGLFGWGGDFASEIGQSYLINALSDHDFIMDGEVVAIPAYSLVQNYNTIMVPLTESGLTLASQVGDDIVNCDALNNYNNVTQQWETASKGLFGWGGDFAVGIASPLLINATTATVWPSAKTVNFVEGDGASTPKALPKVIRYVVKDNAGAYYVTGDENVTFKAWIVGRESEVIQEFSAGCGFEIYGPAPALLLNLQGFASDWADGETIHILAKDEDVVPMQEGSADLVLAGGGSEQDLGYEEWVAGSGLPMDLNIDSSIDGNMPLETSLEQNYPNPFNPTTTINFSLKSEGIAKLNVYNYTGQLVNSLVNGQMNAGMHTVNFDASNLSAGVYYYTLEANNMTMTNKMVLVK